MSCRRRLLLALTPWLVAAGASSPAAVDTAPPPTVEAITRGLERREGLLELFVDRAAGKVWLVLPAPGAHGEVGRFLHVAGLSGGLGSNPVGLDRGLLEKTRLISIRRLGRRVLVEEVNLRFRAISDEAAERDAVRQSFARSVLWGQEVSASDRSGRAVVDFTSFIVRDAIGVAERLEQSGQGSYRFDPERSALELEQCHAFPQNLEFEAVLTWTGGDPADHVAEVVPSPDAITLVQHQSLLRLPDDDYRPRRFDPRAGSFAIEFYDYAQPLDRPIERSWIVRHRLEKTDPSAERSTVKQPIVYYVDRGVPEPVRSALVDGARWWAAAFDAAGLVDAFRVELLPADAHPLDVRYNVIEWVHRSTRGWSYGGGIVDPRTGERIKGHVRLGSLRVRQDRLLFEGLVGTAASGSGAAGDPVELALARIRQLAAHEVGHALGFAHNFAASTYGGRASVMDYPAPLVRIDARGELDLSEAYTTEIGLWDRFAVAYAYSDFPPGVAADDALDALVANAIARGWLFLGDEDARPPGAAHPSANLWDNGADPVEELAQAMRVRRIALDRFGVDNVAGGRPLASLEEVLVPVYLHHRYQLDAAAKTIGGLVYAHALRGDGQPPARPVDPAQQRRALDVILSTLDPVELELPPSITRLLLPRSPGLAPGSERFTGFADPVFDPLAAAATAAEMTITALLQPARATRLVQFHLADPALPSFESLLESLTDRVFASVPHGSESEARREIRRETQRVLSGALIRLARSAEAPASVRVRVDGQLALLRETLERGAGDDAQRRFLRAEIGRHLDRPADAAPLPAAAPAPPPGSPIGAPLGDCSAAADR
ncbi:MAG TPA: zinc-dependent metalloprotease [Candidatus Polarisedimenticolaceae bacterium]|nr:zinc-dependent metalloprotease [Candidatus Polarisedimenticolaceae bacterium]